MTRSPRSLPQFQYFGEECSDADGGGDDDDGIGEMGAKLLQLRCNGEGDSQNVQPQLGIAPLFVCVRSILFQTRRPGLLSTLATAPPSSRPPPPSPTAAPSTVPASTESPTAGTRRSGSSQGGFPRRSRRCKKASVSVYYVRYRHQNGISFQPSGAKWSDRDPSQGIRGIQETEKNASSSLCTVAESFT